MLLTGPQILQIQLASPVTTQEFSYFVSWTQGPGNLFGSKAGLSAGTTLRSMTIGPGPTLRTVKNIKITNLDSESNTITITRKDGNLSAVYYTGVLDPGQFLNFSSESGFSVEDPAGYEPRFYKQSTEPLNAPEGALWIETT